jgi:peptide deformylase
LVLPILAYGHPILRKVARDINPDYPNLQKLIADMWETMYSSNGVGLAAPQVNRDIRLFLVDSQQIFQNLEEDEKKDFPDTPGIKQVFINAHLVEVEGKNWSYNEGCLSIPKIREDITRQEIVSIRYFDEEFNLQHKTFNGITARIILHEYDHIEGKLFIDYLPPLKKKLMKGKLKDISKGKVTVDYKMLFPE